jgi:hypothetical protein
MTRTKPAIQSTALSITRTVHSAQLAVRSSVLEYALAACEEERGTVWGRLRATLATIATDKQRTLEKSSSMAEFHRCIDSTPPTTGRRYQVSAENDSRQHPPDDTNSAQKFPSLAKVQHLQHWFPRRQRDSIHKISISHVLLNLMLSFSYLWRLFASLWSAPTVGACEMQNIRMLLRISRIWPFSANPQSSNTGALHQHDGILTVSPSQGTECVNSTREHDTIAA